MSDTKTEKFQMTDNEHFVFPVLVHLNDFFFQTQILISKKLVGSSQKRMLNRLNNRV